MVGSRHLQGTIISRIRHLLESGSLKTPPLWFDVVNRFPPPATSVLTRHAVKSDKEIPKITYPEDDIKREFYKLHFRAARDPDTLFEDIKIAETKTSLFFKDYYKHLDNGCNQEEALKNAFASFDVYLKSIREKTGKKATIANTSDDEDNGKSLDMNDIYNMLSGNVKPSK